MTAPVQPYYTVTVRSPIVDLEKFGRTRFNAKRNGSERSTISIDRRLPSACSFVDPRFASRDCVTLDPIDPGLERPGGPSFVAFIHSNTRIIRSPLRFLMRPLTGDFVDLSASSSVIYHDARCEKQCSNQPFVLLTMIIGVPGMDLQGNEGRTTLAHLAFFASGGKPREKILYVCCSSFETENITFPLLCLKGRLYAHKEALNHPDMA
ncbi:uncharacterized protein EV420DRAFT_1483305 [Desarmillaria tabescens]|uniref:Uncharacterized protein n=1 Tax=Armillaria tabescens TaxID=1929756 RepID=A0AA39JTZ6_ARMTA|nr:uncharacterized protein EV420DRAFT_1483305 [Desarmillaria tabescens]KAK0448885.1 hypothetical protein EV420DRAFT_1483305 [Desarmillaria tabescens]